MPFGPQTWYMLLLYKSILYILLFGNWFSSVFDIIIFLQVPKRIYRLTWLILTKFSCNEETDILERFHIVPSHLIAKIDCPVKAFFSIPKDHESLYVVNNFSFKLNLQRRIPDIRTVGLTLRIVKEIDRQWRTDNYSSASSGDQ